MERRNIITPAEVPLKQDAAGPVGSTPAPAPRVATPLRTALPRAVPHLVMLASLVIIIAGMRAASSVLVLFMLAAFFAAICTIPLTWLQKKAVPSKLAVGIIACAILALGSLLVVMITLSANGFVADMPANKERLSSLTAATISWLNAHGIRVSGETLLQHFDLGKVMGAVGALLSGLSSVVAGAFLVFMTIVFILLEVSDFPRKVRAVLARPEQSLAGLREFGDAARRYLLIKTLVGVAVGVAIGIWLAVLGVNYAFLWGFLAFLFNFVPYIGCYIAAVPALLLTLVEYGWGTAGLVLLGYLLINTVLGYLVEPRLMGSQLGLSALVVFASLLIWGWVLGPVGMILSVPLTVMLRIALAANDDTRWIAILLGPEPPESQEG